MKLLILCNGGMGTVAKETAEAMGCFSQICVLDDKSAEAVGGLSTLDELRDRFDCVYAAHGDGIFRCALFEKARALCYKLPPIIHPSAVVSRSVILGENVFIGPNSVVNGHSIIQKGSIINSCAVVEHHCRVGAFCHVAPCAVLLGGVNMGGFAFVGAGAVVLPKRKVGIGAIVGAGAVVTKDVFDGDTVTGVPARI